MSILSERRSFQPYGMCGGEPGSRGLNLLHIADSNRIINLGGKNTVHVKPNDSLTIYSPGGGGYGHSCHKESSATTSTSVPTAYHPIGGGSLLQYQMSQESV